MRRRVLIPSVLIAAALVISSCSSDPDSPSETASPEASSSAAATEEAGAEIAGSEAGFTASGAFGEKPTLEFGSDTAPEGLQVETLTEGDGAEVAAGDFVVAHYLGQVWGTETVFDNSFDRGAPSGFSLSGVIDGWSTGLVGQKVGSRVLLTIPSALGYPDGNGSTIAAGDTIVFVVDIVDALNAEAGGEADAAPTDAELPVTIEGALGEPVTAVTINEGTASPTEASATAVSTGTGDVLEAGDTVYVQYTLAAWDSEATETTWPPAGYGIQSVPLGQGGPFDALVGSTVGSRVLLQTVAVSESETPAFAVVVDIIGAA